MVILLSMTGLRNLRAIINESFIRIKGRQGKEKRCECALNCWLGVRGAGGTQEPREEKEKGKKKRKNEAKKRGE